MATPLESEIIKVLEQTRNEIRANMEAQRINASGRTSASLRVEEYPGGVRLVGGYDKQRDITDAPGIYANETAPIQTLEFGREGGKVPRGFYYIIKDWTRAKRLSFENESERATFAYFVAKKIARDGTRRHDNNADVYSTPTVKARDRIKGILRQTVKGAILQGLAGGKIQTLPGAFN